MARDLPALLADLEQESSSLDSILTSLEPREWTRLTPAPGWTVAHQVAHLAWTDAALVSALRTPEAFSPLAAQVAANPQTVDRAATDGANEAPPLLLTRWRDGRAAVRSAILTCPPGQRIPWFGPPMGAATAISARVMETFGHGQDIRDTFATKPVGSERLHHIAHLAVAARDFAFRNHDLPVPTAPFRVELEYDGLRWESGPVDADERVAGSTLDFALLATRRRHRADCALSANGTVADQWLAIMQAYAGDPGHGREPHTSAAAHQPSPGSAKS
ncbi:TIGR03084 family metal-binding protein [Rhodococcus jostii]|uniref:TIGR03084 family metal-binding protein n=1 Tax=Rhodococcus jostii TaxID=132919 RepID=A0ABU4CLV2_RHOJO|nr:TIGR03084 family metal-binding protein [Rhodococcus jostii]MDV6284547.1 TIGR03084 family metal-binding protein [Rhodococcus jostii]